MSSARPDPVAMVQADLGERRKMGLAKYGHLVDVHGDTRDWLQEAYEEALDLCVYLRAQIERTAEDPGCKGCASLRMQHASSMRQITERLRLARVAAYKAEG